MFSQYIKTHHLIIAYKPQKTKSQYISMYGLAWEEVNTSPYSLAFHVITYNSEVWCNRVLNQSCREM